jgi:hypothetical protein
MPNQKPLTESDLVRIEALCAAATPAPWRSCVEGRDHLSGSSFVQTPQADIELTGASTADQDFIASARQDVPTLVQEVRRLQGLLRTT